MASSFLSATDIANGNLTRNLMLYLAQYLKTATGGRVECYSQITQSPYDKISFVRFKCKTCQDNWNVGSHLFAGGGIPTELTDWVEKHQHVCKKFTPKSMHKICDSCAWPWEKHKEGQPYQDSKGDWILPAEPYKKINVHTGETIVPGKIVHVNNPKAYISPISPFIYAPAPAPVPASPKVVQLKEVQGRKFRE